jgi:HAD superfamily hydrolase (TIGR01509 family)
MSAMIPFDPALLSRRGWIFDCDGTLAATMRIHHRTWTHIISKQIGKPFEFPWDLFCAMGGVSAYDTCARLKQLYGIDLDVPLLLADGHDYLEIHLAKDVRPNPAVIAVVHHVKALGHRTAVASAGRKSHVHTTLNTINIMHLFDAVITAEDAKRSKPHPDLFLAAAARIGIEPADCVVIEDSPRGKEAADAAGMACILVEPA